MTADARQIYGTTFDCECGRSHVITPEAVIFAEDAVAQVPERCNALTTGRRVALIDDDRTRAVAGDEVAAALDAAGWTVKRIRLEDPEPGHDPVCDDVTHDWLLPRVGDVDLVLPVGSGVINDLGKWVAGDRELPYATFATAASMNGYTSANVAPKIAGVKSLVRARPPAVAFSRPSIIAGAPPEMTVSGLGDVLAKSVSSTDWYLNHLLFGDYFCPRAVKLVADIEPLYLEHPDAIRLRDEGAIAAMFDALMLTGVAMTMVGTSAPASGGEHLVSHALDMMSAVDGQPHDFHGRQVGMGTILTSELYRRVLAVESPELHAPPADIDRELWGPLADEVAHHFDAKRERLALARERIADGDTWDRLRETLAPMLRTPECLHGCLEAAGGAVKAEDIKCDRDRLHTAFVHGFEIRSRFTVMDLAYLLGVLPTAGREIVERWG